MSTSCSIRDNKINETDWPEIEQQIQSDAAYSDQKKKYIIDELSFIMNDEEQIKSKSGRSFDQLIKILSHSYDSLNSIYKSIHSTNSVLDELVDLEKAESISLDAERGFIIFTLNFNKIFQDSIEYMILTYQYIDDYDNLYFSENSKLSYQAAGKFEGKLQSIMTDIFNGQNEIIYLKTDLSAAEVLQKNYGIDDVTSTNDKEYLNEGLKVMVSAVQFENGKFMKRRKGDWKYLD